MDKPSNSYWKSLSIWARLSIIWSIQPNDILRVSKILRWVSLVQALLLITDNTRDHISSEEMVFYQLKLATNFSEIVPYSVYPWVTLGIIGFYFFTICSVTTLKIYLLNAEKQREEKSSYVFALASTVHVEILFYPINQCLCGLLSNLTDSQSDIIQKATTISIVFILVCFNAILTFYKIMFCYFRIRSKKFISRKGSIHLIGIVILKLFLPLFQSLINNNSEEGLNYDIINVVVSLIISVGLLAYTMIVIPEYNTDMIKMHIVFNSLLIGVSSIQLAKLFFGQHNVSLDLIFLLMPIWVKLNLNIFQSIIKKLKYSPGKIANNHQIISLETIFEELEYSIITNSAKLKTSASTFDTESLICNIFQANSDQRSDEDKTIYFEKQSKMYLKRFFESLLTKNVKNVLFSLTYAKLIISHFSLYSKAYHLCQSASKQRISIPDRISIYHLINKIEKGQEKTLDTRDVNNSISSKFILQGFKYDVELQEFKSQFSKYAEQTISFWKILQVDNPDVRALFKHATSIEKNKLSIESMWKRYESENAGEVSLIHLLYGVYSVHFLNMPFKGTQYIEKYCSYMKNRNLNNGGKMQFKKDEYGTIMISGDKKNIGEIMYCSDLISEIFMRDKKSLIGKNVTTIMPRFFHNKHHSFLLEQYELGRRRIIGKESLVYAKDVNNDIFPVSIITGVHLDLEKGIMYTGVLKKIKDQNEYILLNDDGIIEETSILIRKISGIEAFKKIKISSVCLGFDFEVFKKSLLLNGDDTREEDISIKVNGLVELRKSYGIEIYEEDRNNDNKEIVFNFRARINRYLYCNEVLNVMVLQFKDDKQKKIKEIIALHELRRNDVLNLESVTDKDMTRILPQNKKFQKIAIFDTQIKKSVNEIQKVELNSQLLYPVQTSDTSPIPTNSNKFETENQILRTFGPYERENLSPPPKKNNRLSDNIQDIFSKPHPNRFKNTMINLFIIILVTFLCAVDVQYFELEGSIQDIDFTISAIRTSYERLTSLSLIWWFANAYHIRLIGFLPRVESELDRFKLRIRGKRQEVKSINDKLMNIVAMGDKYQQQRFFREDITLTYSNISVSLDERKVNSFEAINLFIEKLIEFDTTPHEILLQTGNSNLLFVKQNLIDDLLLNSEELVEAVQNVFADEIQNKKFRMAAIFILNILIGCITIVLAFVIFFINDQRERRLIRALMSIHPQNVELTISKLSSFQNLLKKKEKLLSQVMHNFHIQSSLSTQSLKNFKLNKTQYRINGLIRMKLKQILILNSLIFGISIVSSIRYISSNKYLADALITNDQIILVSKVSHISLLAYSTLVDMIGNLNTTTMRNQPMASQLIQNIYDIPPSNIIFDAFTDDAGQLIDADVETLLKGKSCSFVVNFLGSLNDVNCPKVTQNDSIGMLAVYTGFREELYDISKAFIANITTENALTLLPILPDSLSPKINTIYGGFMYLIDFLSQKLNTQILNLLADARTKLIVQNILIGILSLIIIWFLMKITFDDYNKRIILKIIPCSEISSNKFLKNYIKGLYKERIDLLEQNR